MTAPRDQVTCRENGLKWGKIRGMELRSIPLHHRPVKEGGMLHDLTPEVIARFWSKVAVGDPDACWLWQGSQWQDYGHFWLSGKSVMAHRLSWAMAYQADPGPLVIRHDCDTPLCVNPNHLRIGTYGDNLRDAHQRGRRVGGYGENHHQAKLTDAQVVEIRRAVEAGEMHKDVAARYGVSRSAVTYIVNGKRRARAA